MIYTLTTNPAIDMNISSEKLMPKVVNRTFNAEYSPNGKGLNVSFVLKHFGVESKILGFFGGFSGKYIMEESIKMGFEVIPVEVDENTRINVFLNDGKEEYKLVNEGSFVDTNKQKQLLQIINDASDMEYLSISGSLAKGIDEEFYEQILKTASQKNTKVILDISSKKLKHLLQYHPYLIKPNDEEIFNIFNIMMKDEADIIDVLEMLYQKGAMNILLTLGEKGSYFYNGQDMYYCNTKEIHLLSSACAGDSALGGFLSIWLQNNKKIEEAMKRAAATGANVAQSNGIGPLDKVNEYINDITVRKVK